MPVQKVSAASLTKFNTTQPGRSAPLIGTNRSGKSTFSEKLAGAAGRT
jgi:ABC-type hemin transport system ATPase subunit